MFWNPSLPETTARWRNSWPWSGVGCVEQNCQGWTLKVRNGTEVKFPSVPREIPQGTHSRGWQGAGRSLYLRISWHIYSLTKNPPLAESPCIEPVSLCSARRCEQLGDTGMCLWGHQHLFEDVPAHCRWPLKAPFQLSLMTLCGEMHFSDKSEVPLARPGSWESLCPHCSPCSFPHPFCLSSWDQPFP